MAAATIRASPVSFARRRFSRAAVTSSLEPGSSTSGAAGRTTNAARAWWRLCRDRLLTLTSKAADTAAKGRVASAASISRRWRWLQTWQWPLPPRFFGFNGELLRALTRLCSQFFLARGNRVVAARLKWRPSTPRGSIYPGVPPFSRVPVLDSAGLRKVRHRIRSHASAGSHASRLNQVSPVITLSRGYQWQAHVVTDLVGVQLGPRAWIGARCAREMVVGA